MTFTGHHVLANRCCKCGRLFTVDTLTHYTPFYILSSVNPFSICHYSCYRIQTTITTSCSHCTATREPITAIIVFQLQTGLYNYSGGGSSMPFGPHEGVSWSGLHATHRHTCPWRNLFVCAHWSAPYKPSKLRSMHGLQTNSRHLLHLAFSAVTGERLPHHTQ
jgi:hypothetical protein